MKLTKNYMLKKIDGTNYLLPIGQGIALFKKSLQLNETSTLLWNALESGLKEEDLTSYLMEYYGADASDVPILQADIYLFLQQLAKLHLIDSESITPSCDIYLNIGNLIIGYHGPKHLLHPSLLDFECGKNTVGQNWILVPQAPDPYPLGEIIIRTGEIEIIRNSREYIITLTSACPTIQIKISLDGVNACFYCKPPYYEDLIEPLFHAFRHAFLLYAQKKGVFALHSSSILYKDKVWLFSAPSGTGKSTQADLWKKLHQTRILNGDLNLILLQASTPMVVGLPWCGTSQIYSNEAFPLGGVILLKKHSNNRILELTKPQQILYITQRLISPAWTEDMVSANIDFSHSLVEQIPVFQFLCRKEPTAVQILRDYIQSLL